MKKDKEGRGGGKGDSSYWKSPSHLGGSREKDGAEAYSETQSPLASTILTPTAHPATLQYLAEGREAKKMI